MCLLSPVCVFECAVERVGVSVRLCVCERLCVRVSMTVCACFSGGVCTLMCVHVVTVVV